MNPFRGLFGQSLWQTVKSSSVNTATKRTARQRPRAIAAEVDVLEDRLVLSPGVFVMGSDFGGPNRVTVYGKDSGLPLYTFNPYSDAFGFPGGIRTAVGYVPGSSEAYASTLPVIITAPGPGLGFSLNSPAPVRVYAALNGFYFNIPVVRGQLISAINPFPNFGGGVFVATADFDRDGHTDIITGADGGGGPHVIITSFNPVRILFSQFVYGANFRGGVRVAAGFIDGDGFPDLVVGAGPGGGPHVRVFSGFNGVQLTQPIGSFFAYSVGFTGGVYVGTGNFDGVGGAEVITGAGAGGGPHVRIISISQIDPSNPLFDVNPLNQFPFETNFTGGVRVASGYVDDAVSSNLIADLFVSRGPGRSNNPFLRNIEVRVFSGATPTVLFQGSAFRTPSAFGGSFPAAGRLDVELLQLSTNQEVPAEGAASITTEEAQSLLQAAIGRFEAAGVSASALGELGSLQIEVGNLGGRILGNASPGSIVLDVNAAGFGWFVDPTPFFDEEFGTNGWAIDPAAIGKVDLFTVLLHELGHQLGLHDLDPAIDPHQLMAGTLNVGERRLPDRSAIDSLFAGESMLDDLMAPSAL